MINGRFTRKVTLEKFDYFVVFENEICFNASNY